LCVIALTALLMPAMADKVDDLIWDLSYDASPTVRAEAAISLGRVGDARAVDPLIEALSDGNELVRAAAAQALGRIGDPKAVDPLIRTLNSVQYDVYENQEVQKQTIWALGYIGDPKAVDPLIRSLEVDPVDAASALGQIGDPRAVDPLIKALNDDNYFTRRAAASALGEIGDPRAIGPLTKALDDHWVEAYAAEALKEINESVTNPPSKAIDEIEDTAEPINEPAASSVPTVDEEPEETPNHGEESPLPLSIGALSLITAALFIRSRREMM